MEEEQTAEACETRYVKFIFALTPIRVFRELQYVSVSYIFEIKFDTFLH